MSFWSGTAIGRFMGYPPAQTARPRRGGKGRGWAILFLFRRPGSAEKWGRGLAGVKDDGSIEAWARGVSSRPRNLALCL